MLTGDTRPYCRQKKRLGKSSAFVVGNTVLQSWCQKCTLFHNPHFPFIQFPLALWTLDSTLNAVRHFYPIPFLAIAAATRNIQIAAYNVTWYKDGIQIHSEESLKNVDRVFADKTSLKITSVYKEDAGVYQCFVGAEGSNHQATAELRLGGTFGILPRSRNANPIGSSKALSGPMKLVSGLN